MKPRSRSRRARFRFGWLVLLSAWAGVPMVSDGQAVTVDQLVRMGPAELDALYRGASPGPVPSGRVRGTALVRPGSRLAAPLSRGARLVWQGKVFHPEGASMVNRFFGVRMIRASVAYGPSWMDGQPSLILDYRGSSRLYARYRDEVRQIGPGLYLGVMYQRAGAQPTIKLYFVLEDPAASR